MNFEVDQNLLDEWMAYRKAVVLRVQKEYSFPEVVARLAADAGTTAAALMLVNELRNGKSAWTMNYVEDWLKSVDNYGLGVQVRNK